MGDYSDYDLARGPGDLYPTIKQIRDNGGDVMLSFGGASGTPLAAVCTVDELSSLLDETVNNLNLKIIDFDIEGGAIADHVGGNGGNTGGGNTGGATAGLPSWVYSLDLTQAALWSDATDHYDSQDFVYTVENGEKVYYAANYWTAAAPADNFMLTPFTAGLPWIKIPAEMYPNEASRSSIAADEESEMQGVERRNAALVKLQAKWSGEGKNIKTAFTLPVLPSGLTSDGYYVINDAVTRGVKLDLVNLMTMDYGGEEVCPHSENKPLDGIQAQCGIDAVTNVHSQLSEIYQSAGVDKSDAAIWAMLGTTPMIGVNDVEPEVFIKMTVKSQQNSLRRKV